MNRTSPLLAVVLSLFALATSHCSASGDASTESAPPQASSSSRGVSALDLRGCASCHDGARGGLSGSDTPVPGTRMFAPNLTPDPDTGLGRWSDDQIARAIREGIDDQGEALCGTMPSFGAMGDAEIQRLVADLRALAPVRHQAPGSTCDDPRARVRGSER